MKGVINASNEELGAWVDRCEKAAFWSGVLVIVGLVVEVVLAYRQGPPNSFEGIWGPVIADAMVAAGVAGEILFSRIGASRQRELQRRADIKVAELNDRAAAAEERTAKIEKLTTWRRVSASQISKIADAVRGTVTGLSVTVESQRADAEAFLFSQDLIKVFREAGVEPTKIRWGENEFLGATGFDAWITGGSEGDVTGIATAFMDSRVKLFPWYAPDMSRGRILATMPAFEPRPDLYIFVCPKPPPSLDF